MVYTSCNTLDKYLYEFTNDDNYKNNTNIFFHELFIFMSVMFGSVVISCFIVSQYIYHSYNRHGKLRYSPYSGSSSSSSDNDDVETDEQVETKTPFEDLYPVNHNVEHINTEPSKYTYITEYTPNGLVFMQYNKDEEGFYYWSNHSIQFKYLETVARKYVNFLHCKDYYIERNPGKHGLEREEKETGTGQKTEGHTDNQRQQHDIPCDTQYELDGLSESPETVHNNDGESRTELAHEPEPSPFANLKGYNNNTTYSSGGKDNNPGLTVDIRTKHTSCKFIKKGRIDDLNLLHINEEEPNNKHKSIDFTSFKTLFMMNGENKT